MTKLLLTTFLYLFSCYSLAANLSATVDRYEININETLLLTVTLDKQGANDINFDALELQFDILQRQRGSQTSIINGKINAKTQWTLVLSPKETGKLIIPSFESLGAFSDAISIQVNDSNSSANTKNLPSNNEIYLESTVNKNRIYVQEQLLLTLRLHYRISLSGYTPEDLIIDGNTVELAAENNYQKTINGIPYNVLERVYAIHPQASGALTIPALSWQVEKASHRFGFGRTTSPYMRVKSQAHQIEVMPAPKESTAQQWLPAANLSLKQEWQQSTITAKVGEPLTYSLIIKAEGLHYAQLPSIDIRNDENFTIYSDQAKTDNQLSNNGITGTRINNYAVIPKSAGTYSLPPITLKWWNTTTDQEETIRLNSQRIVVASSDIESASKLPEITKKPQKNENVTDTNNMRITHWAWQLSTIIFALLALLFLFFWRSTNKKLEGKNKKESGTTSIKPSLKQVYQEINTAIENKEWLQLRSLLKKWASLKTQASINSHDDIIHHFPELHQALLTLDKQLYAEESAEVWDFKELLPILQKQTISKQTTKESKPLKNLYNV